MSATGHHADSSCRRTSLIDATSPTAKRFVREFIRRASSKALSTFVDKWDLQKSKGDISEPVVMHLAMKCNALNVELKRLKLFEECRLKYTKVLGKEWGDEAKLKADRSRKQKDRRKESSRLSPRSHRNKSPQRQGQPGGKTERSNSVEIEKPLPSLPLPSLQQTLERYLRVLRPITTVEGYEQAVRLVHEFIETENEGPRLQALLKQRATNRSNWAMEYWLNEMYLDIRLPLPIHSNPGMVFPRNKFTHSHDQLKFAARLVSGILDYKVIIDARGLPIDRANTREKGQPLCMEQYYRLFSSYRVPGVTRDQLITTENEGDESEHIIVMWRNKMFVLPVVVGETRLSEDNICCQLRRICQMSGDRPDQSSISILTSLSRNLWATTRELLMQDSTNQENLKLIETSIFILCLDRALPHDEPSLVEPTDGGVKNGQEEDRSYTSLALQMLHGQGTHINSCNRWYDKTMQFIIGEDGACGLNYEHSPSEGVAVVQLIEHVLKYMNELRTRKLVRMDSIIELPSPIKLEWNVDDAIIIQHTDMARYRMDRALMDLSLQLLMFDRFGRDFPKAHNMSPDCFIQLSLQLAFYRCHGHLVSTYESASVRRFQLGRVDNIRAASCEALLWCQAMLDETKSAADRMNLLREAVKSQTDYMVNTILGYGIDNHMTALNALVVENKMKMPALFTDETWSIANDFRLSTSQVNTSLDSFMGYGPVVHNGYGASYNPQKYRIVFCITSFKSCDNTDSSRFTMALESSLVDMQALCETSKQLEQDSLDSINEKFRLMEGSISTDSTSNNNL